MLHAEKKSEGRWVASWTAAPVASPSKSDTFKEMTIRNFVHLSLGGRGTRIVLTNEFGTSPLTINGVSVAMSAGNGVIKPGSSQVVKFGGRETVVIPAGALMVSDPVEFEIPAAADLAVSMYVPEQTMTICTAHNYTAQENFRAAGNQLTAEMMADAKKLGPWFFLKGVEVFSASDAATVVTFGDSITDGHGSTLNANHRYPNFLAARVLADAKLKHLAVVDEGIGGNRVLHDQTGPNALARFDRDVLAVPGAKYVIVLESINDIGRMTSQPGTPEAVTAIDLIVGLQQMIDRAHERGLKIFGATLTPYEGAKYYSESGEAIREQINAWIRTSGHFDAVIDFDKATQDPANPKRYLPAYDLGDHLHPSDAGYQRMADAVDLTLFR